MANEKRLIDANALAEQVDNLCADWNENWIGNDNQSFILHSDVSDLICDAPTVDAVPVDDILLHHILIDENGIPEVKLQFGDRTLVLRSEGDPVDAVEVVHGEWSTIEDDYCGLTALQCSECNQEYWFEDEPPMKIYNYCPNCGAMMDGGKR